jgi:hypothetical protein
MIAPGTTLFSKKISIEVAETLEHQNLLAILPFILLR